MGSTVLHDLAGLTAELQRPHTLEEQLQLVAQRAAALLDLDRATIRLLDASRQRLLVGCRVGAAFHENANFEFRVGEGLLGWVAAENRPLRMGRASDDPRFMKRADQRDEVRSFLAVPLSHEGECVGVISVAHHAPDRFTPEHEAVLTLLAGLCAPYLEIARLARLPFVDELTGTLNDKGLEQTLPDDLETAGPLALAVVDVDQLERVNVTCGHAVGDELLRAVGQTLAGSLRVGDAVARLGGDEFLLLTPNVSINTAARIFERARHAVENATVVIAGRSLSTTVSVGVAERLPRESRAGLLQRAQGALGAAKRVGGNCVRVAIED
jgi:diguanylate cyclase (GGDEF)-like protein